MKNYSVIGLLVILITITGCSLGDDLNPNEETSKQKNRLTNYLHDFSDQDEKVSFSRDGLVTVNDVHYSANQINMFSEYKTKDSLQIVNSSVQMYDASGNLLSEKSQEMVNKNEYSFFAFGVLGETGWSKPGFAIIESDIVKASDGKSHVRFAHFNPSYKNVKVEVEGQIIPLGFGEISEKLSYEHNSAFEYSVLGEVNGNFVSVHGSGTINHNAQNNHIMILSKMGQGDDQNGVFDHTEIWN